MSYERFRYEMPSREFQNAWSTGRYKHSEARRYAEEPCAEEDAVMQYSAPVEQPSYEVVRAPAEPYDPDTLSFSYITEFNFNGQVKPLDVVIREQDLVALWARNSMSKHLKYDLKRVVPLSIQIVGSTMKQPAPFSVQVFDASGLPLFDTHGANTSCGETNCDYGWPLYVDDKNVYRSAGKIPKHYRDYANLKIEDIKSDVLKMEYPNGPVYMMIPRRNGFYYAWVLEVLGNSQDDILNNPAYQDPGHSDYIRLSAQDFHKCIKHYEDALSKIKFHNMEKITVRLIPHCSRIKDEDLHSLVLNFTIRAGEAAPELVKQRVTMIKAPVVGGHGHHHGSKSRAAHDYEKLRGAYKSGCK